MQAHLNLLILEKGKLGVQCKMNYKEIIKKSMEEIAIDEKARFIGYNLKRGSKAYGTLTNVSESRILEMPIAENLMAGVAMGMSLEGYKPVLIFERHDFMLNALDSLVNHLDKLSLLSNDQYKAPMLIRAVVGSLSPINPGPQHCQDFSEFFKRTFHFPVYDPKNVLELRQSLEEGKKFEQPVMIIERRDLYDLK